jgi:hypothetical protein
MFRLVSSSNQQQNTDMHKKEGKDVIAFFTPCRLPYESTTMSLSTMAAAKARLCHLSIKIPQACMPLQ